MKTPTLKEIENIVELYPSLCVEKIPTKILLMALIIRDVISVDEYSKFESIINKGEQ